MKKISLILALIFFAHPLQAQSLTLQAGSSINYSNINNPNFKFKTDPFPLSSITIGLMYQNDTPFIYGISTNIINQATNQEVTSRSSVKFNLRSKTTANAAIVGYKIKNFIPSIFIANVKVDQLLSNDNVAFKKQTTYSLMYGLSISYYLTKDISVNFAIIAPNKELYLEAGGVFGLNYNFNLLNLR